MEDARKPGQAGGGRRVRADGPHDVPKRKLTLVVPEEDARRLHVHALMTNTDRSDLVARWIRDQCRRFVVQDRGGRPAVNPDDGASRVVETPPVDPVAPADVAPDPPAGEGGAASPPARRRKGQAADGPAEG